jgi:hypothetical protein
VPTIGEVINAAKIVLCGDPESLLAHPDASLADDYKDFSFERNEPQPLELHAVTEPPLRPGGENPAIGTPSTCNSSMP